jgi:hypothetical protein
MTPIYITPITAPHSWARPVTAPVYRCAKPTGAAGWRDLACVEALLAARALNAVCDAGGRLQVRASTREYP